ncbi:MAG: hypothetical protein WCJ56_11315, partial [bacterium]
MSKKTDIVVKTYVCCMGSYQQVLTDSVEKNFRQFWKTSVVISANSRLTKGKNGLFMSVKDILPALVALLLSALSSAIIPVQSGRG